jgi:hypothetical protein
MVWTRRTPSIRPPVAGQFSGEVPVDFVDIGQREVAPAHAGLVGDDEELETGVLQ